MGGTKAIARPVALAELGAALSALSPGRSGSGGGDGGVAAALGAVVAGGGVRA